MNKYVIAFNYKPFPNSDSITEYFLPYTQDALLEIITNKDLRRRLEESKDQGKNLDTFVEKYNLQDFPIIKRMNEIISLPDTSHWINDINDMSDLSMWDYLADAICVNTAHKYHFDNRDYVNALATTTYNSRVFFDRLKLIISLLVYTDSDDKPINLFTSPFNNGPTPSLPNSDINNLLNFCKYVCHYLQNWPYVHLDNNYFLELFSHPNAYIRNKTVKIYSLINELDERKLLDEDCHQYQKEICVLLDELLKKLLPSFYERTRTIAILQALYYGTKIQIKPDIETMHMCLNEVNYEDEKYTFITQILSTNIHTFINFVEAISTTPPLSANTLKRLNKQLANPKALSNFGYKEFHKKNGCFALLITDKNEHYFSFSSAKEISKDPSTKKDMEDLVKIVMENVFQIKGVDDIYTHKYDYNWCYLKDDLDVRRYTEILTHGSEDLTKYISAYHTYDDDITNGLRFKNKLIGNTYGCCERKLLAYSTYPSSKEIYSRWAPCWRCRPAVLDAQPCDFYAFADVEDKKNGQNIDMSLKKYFVTRSYSVNS